MTKTLKCHRCKKPIKEDEKAYRCSECETYPFHEDCLDEDGYCTACLNEKEKEDENEEKWQVDLTLPDDTNYFSGLTKKQAEAMVKKIERAINTGRPKIIILSGNDDDDDDEKNPTKYVVKHIVAFGMKARW